MIKKLLFALAVVAQLIAQTVCAQTFHIVNLTVSGTSVFSGTVTLNGVAAIAYSNPVFSINDTSGSNSASMTLLDNGVTRWGITGNSSTNTFTIGRYNTSSALVDSPLSISPTSGAVTMLDGITGTPISGSTGSFTTLSTSSTASFGVRPTFNSNTPWDSGNLPNPAVTTNPLSQFAATTSSQLAGVVSDETGSGSLVFANTPTLTNPTINGANFTGTVTGISSITGRLLNVRVFATTGTYTPTSGTTSIILKIIGGGGGGGATASTTSGTFSQAQGGGSGSYAESRITSGFSGVTITVGAGGAGGATAGATGTAGGTSSFGALVSTPGGTGGQGATLAFSSGTIIGSSTSSSVSTGGNLYCATGTAGGPAIGFGASNAISGAGAASPFGGGGNSIISTTAAGQAAVSYGTGGGGGLSVNGGSFSAGGAGATGVVIIYEYQ